MEGEKFHETTANKRHIKNKDGIELDQDWHESSALGFPCVLANFKFEFDNSYH